jgi:hypothetical protein
MFKIGASDSSLCDCGMANETVDHKILLCPLLNDSREKITDIIELGYVRTYTNPSDRTIDIATLTGNNTHLPPEMDAIIRRAFSRFLSESLPVI